MTLQELISLTNPGSGGFLATPSSAAPPAPVPFSQSPLSRAFKSAYNFVTNPGPTPPMAPVPQAGAPAPQASALPPASPLPTTPTPTPPPQLAVPLPQPRPASAPSGTPMNLAPANPGPTAAIQPQGSTAWPENAGQGQQPFNPMGLGFPSATPGTPQQQQQAQQQQAQQQNKQNQGMIPRLISDAQMIGSLFGGSGFGGGGSTVDPTIIGSLF